MLLEREERGEEERDRNFDVRKKHGLVASCMCRDWGSSELRPGIKPANFGYGTRSNQLSSISQGHTIFYQAVMLYVLNVLLFYLSIISL